MYLQTLKAISNCFSLCIWGSKSVSQGIFWKVHQTVRNALNHARRLDFQNTRCFSSSLFYMITHKAQKNLWTFRVNLGSNHLILMSLHKKEPQMLLQQKLLEYFCKNATRPVSFLRQKLNKEIILDRFDFETRYFFSSNTTCSFSFFSDSYKLF